MEISVRGNREPWSNSKLADLNQLALATVGSNLVRYINFHVKMPSSYNGGTTICTETILPL